MSSFGSFRGIARYKAYTDHYRSEEEPWGVLSTVHPYHPMRRAETIKASSLSEMQSVIPLGASLRGQNKMLDEIGYIISGGEKPSVDIYASSYSDAIIPIAATVTASEDTFNADGVRKAIVELLWRKVDAIEAILWWNILASNCYYLNLPTPATSFREIFAFGRAFLMRLNPELFFDALMSPRAYGAMLLDNAAGANQDSAYTEHQIAAGVITPVPVASNYRPLNDGGSYIDESIVMYPLSFPLACKRYIYEVEHVNKVIDATQDRNIIRVTCERYLSLLLPYDYYSEYLGRPVFPVAFLDASGAINSISNKYSAGTLDNLNYVTAVV